MSIPQRTTAWQPLYPDATLLGPLVENCIEVVKRDQVEALAWAKARLAAAGMPLDGTDKLPPFRSVRNTDMKDTKFPWLIIEPERTSADEQENGERLNEDHRIAIEMAITGKDPEQLTRSLSAYVLAVHMMLTSAGPKELLAGYGPCVDVTWEVKDHDYSRSAENESGYLRAAKMTLYVKFSEVMTNA